jgi:hypothetical protein
MFVPISVTEFQKAYATVLHVLSGNLEFAPGVLRKLTARDTRHTSGVEAFDVGR